MYFPPTHLAPLLRWSKREIKQSDPTTSSSLLSLLLSSFSPSLCEIKFPCGSRICCTARWFIRDAKSMQKQSLLHPFPACQPGSCWLFIKGAAQVRRMHPDALIDCLLPCGDSSWMDWTAGGDGGEVRGGAALTLSLLLPETLLHGRTVSLQPNSRPCKQTQTSLYPVFFWPPSLGRTMMGAFKATDVEILRRAIKKMTCIEWLRNKP